MPTFPCFPDDAQERSFPSIWSRTYAYLTKRALLLPVICEEGRKDQSSVAAPTKTAGESMVDAAITILHLFMK
ncbi:hypothetical protein D9757_013564 [Collybiopsis confluens]|uniref:Uncharacterized protein n=1 Tax=Collybiopsis confluens TaxID=2823264 RepID=A0A8H5CT74_9AGAR|nr:hypothetical protein D9757_013564 [Collybiopsis confluens]